MCLEIEITLERVSEVALRHCAKKYNKTSRKNCFESNLGHEKRRTFYDRFMRTIRMAGKTFLTWFKKYTKLISQVSIILTETR